ncbi:DUF3999 family protein [Cellvibrio sp. pealriver]|uniref:DUF3999 family protein n=1 Tax=Cellvibrio sp. pealriver TaxID=1622269 RepID=UPI00066FFDA4|nr:DUF3999 family protein [Cellvibrio sp. pealriver]
MMNFKKCIALGAMLFGVSTAATAEVIPVYQISEASGTFLQTTLTHDIYRYSADTQLNDLVVTDQQGNRLPYRIAAPSVQSSEQTNFTPVRFFPVAVGTAPETLLVLSSASIRLDDNQISVSAVKADKEELQNQSAPTDFFVVDLSDLRTRADKLAVLWPINEQHQYLEVDVSGTNDMTNWSPITKTTLVQLSKEGERLTRNKITLNLSERQYAYLKLKFTRGNEQLQLTQVQVENTDTIANAPTSDVWQISGELADEQKSALYSINGGAKVQTAAWEFERDDIAPVSNVSINLGAVMYGDSIKVFSRNTEKQPWNLVHQGIWFNAQVGDTWQQSDAINVYNNSDTQWRIELNELVRTTAKPQLTFTRQPEILQFIANNAAPYNIAIDTQVAPGNQQTTTQIFAQLVNGKDIQWSQSNATELKPNLNSFARHGMPISWKTILFWAIMIGAVGVLIWVAVRLMGQMKN